MRRGFGERVRRFREALGYETKAALARELKVQAATVGAWEDAATASEVRDSSVRLLAGLAPDPVEIERWLRHGGTMPEVPRPGDADLRGGGVVTVREGYPGGYPAVPWGEVVGAFHDASQSVYTYGAEHGGTPAVPRPFLREVVATLVRALGIGDGGEGGQRQGVARG